MIIHASTFAVSGSQGPRPIPTDLSVKVPRAFYRTTVCDVHFIETSSSYIQDDPRCGVSISLFSVSFDSAS